MDSTLKILILYADRAEKSILDPVKDSLAISSTVNYINLSEKVHNLHLDKQLSKVYDWTYEHLCHNKYDKLVVLGDRREITFACLAAFVKQVPVVQLASGDMSDSLATVDDYFRHIITILSQQQIAFSDASLQNTKDLLQSIGAQQNAESFVNPTFSSIDIDLLNPLIEEPYDLILVHPQSLSREETIKDAEQVKKLITPNKKNVIICGNKDNNYDILESLWETLGGSVPTTDKQTFLSLIKYCDRFITNSSCSYYEAPLLLEDEKIIRIGERNNGREIVRYNKGDLNSSNKIANFILDVR